MPREEAYTTDAENALSLGWETLASLTETILTLLHFQKKPKTIHIFYSTDLDCMWNDTQALFFVFHQHGLPHL